MTDRSILIAATRGNASRMIQLRRAGLDQFLTDPRVVRQFARSDRLAGVPRAAAAVRRCTTATDQLPGHRTQRHYDTLKGRELSGHQAAARRLYAARP